MSEYPIINSMMGHLPRNHHADFGPHNIESCSICRELAHGKNIIWETEHFAAFPDIGQIVEGYVQIVTRQHRQKEELTSAGIIPLTWMPELAEFITNLQTCVESIYGRTILFEHGEVPTYRKDGRVRTVHMHLHMIPTDSSILDQIVQCGLFQLTEIDSFAPLRLRAASGKPYYFYQELNGQKYLLDFNDELPSQILRKFVSSLPQIRSANDKWLRTNTSSVELENCWECMDFRPADRFYSTVKRVRQEYLNRFNAQN